MLDKQIDTLQTLLGSEPAGGETGISVDVKAVMAETYIGRDNL